jgi:hypothetical protein
MTKPQEEHNIHNRRKGDRRCGGTSYLYEMIFGLFIGLVIVALGLAMYFAMVDHLNTIYEKNRICLTSQTRLSELSETNLQLSDKLCFDFGVCN